MSVAWGTFVLVVLLGAGRGLQNSVAWQFRDDATNSIWLYSGETSRPFEGRPINRPIQFDNDDFAHLLRTDGIDRATGRFYLRGPTIAYKQRSASFSVRSVHPDHQYLENTEVTAGRFIDVLDLEHKRKVAVIGGEVAEFLFRGIDPLGEWINVARVPFRVVGVFKDTGGSSEMRQIYLPVTTAQATFGGGNRSRVLDQMMFTVGDAGVEQANAVASEVVAMLAARHHFDPEDRKAVRVRNNVEAFQDIQRIFRLLDAFVWLVGVGTVTAGIVGVSNIMLVSVRERTSEIGLRKALGATPGQIVGGILQEAVFLTASSGYLGLVAGVALLEALRLWLPENDYLREPQVTLGPAVAATVLLVVFGGLAGFVPAWRAARVHPVEALRNG
ncbi:MAG TPA: ABC transporter permease [Deltaproteobacteria bacterium]|nr:ABC transporter permease [Deltaproteobacteria bacterium]